MENLKLSDSDIPYGYTREEYEKFLLTYKKVQMELALKKIDPEEILELRRKELNKIIGGNIDEVVERNQATQNLADIKRLLADGKTPNELIKLGHSVDDLLKVGVSPDDIPVYKHFTQGEGVVRGNKPGVKGAHNINAFYAAIEADAKRLGVSVDCYNITETPHPDVKGVYEIKYDVVKENGLGKPLKDANNNVQIRPAYEVKTVYDPKEISDGQMYDMGRKELEPQINAGKIGIIIGEYNGLKFKGHVQSDGTLESFYPIFDD